MWIHNAMAPRLENRVFMQTQGFTLGYIWIALTGLGCTSSKALLFNLAGFE